MTRSGRITTHPVRATKITLASAAIPGVVSVRPPHDVGDSELPMPLPEICRDARRVEDREGKSEQPGGAQEPNREDVFDTFRPGRGDQHQ